MVQRKSYCKISNQIFKKCFLKQKQFSIFEADFRHTSASQIDVKIFYLFFSYLRRKIENKVKSSYAIGQQNNLNK